jgi:hypothetical protein
MKALLSAARRSGRRRTIRADASGAKSVQRTGDFRRLGRPEQQLNRALLAFVGVVQIAGIPDFGEQA